MKLIGTFIKKRTTQGKYEYVGSVGKEEIVNGKGVLTVLSVGVEDTQEAIIQWIKDTIAMMRDMNREDVQAMDKYDRNGTSQTPS